MLAQLADTFDDTTWAIIIYGGLLSPAIGCCFLARRSSSWEISQRCLNYVTSFYVAALAMQVLHFCAFLVVLVFGIPFGLGMLVFPAPQPDQHRSQLSSLFGKQAIATFAIIVIIIHSLLMESSLAYMGFWHGIDFPF